MLTTKITSQFQSKKKKTEENNNNIINNDVINQNNFIENIKKSRPYYVIDYFSRGNLSDYILNKIYIKIHRYSQWFPRKTCAFNF